VAVIGLVEVDSSDGEADRRPRYARPKADWPESPEKAKCLGKRFSTVGNKKAPIVRLLWALGLELACEGGHELMSFSGFF
jgi:hypothetical protein